MAPSLAKLRAQFEKQERLSVEEALNVIHNAHDIMNKESNVLYLNAPVVVFGDIHGQFFDLMKLLDKCQFFLPSFAQSDQSLLFLGDYVDRGAFSCEVMLFLLCMKIHYPTRVFLLRGNHECEGISSFYGFRLECKSKYGLSVYYHFIQCFQALPLAAVVTASEGRVFCVHAGISPAISTLADIEALNRHQEPATNGPLCDLLWSDPVPEYEEEDENSTKDEDGHEPQRRKSIEPETTKWQANSVRGCSYFYNCAAVYEFLTANNLMCMIRAHELQDEGYLFHFSSPAYSPFDTRPDKSFPPVITVFSAANYCDAFNNMAAYLIVQKEANRFDVEQTSHVLHPFPRSFHQSEGIWATFQTTLPYIPASKDFFEEMAVLQHLPPEVVDEVALAPAETPATSDDEPVGLNLEEWTRPTDSGGRRKLSRKNSSEKHPQALSKALDAITNSWKSKGAQSDVANMPTDRLAMFTPREIDVLKLIFSLMDVDGDLKLDEDEISRFIQRILGERISDAKAKRYLQALDCNHDGVVDLNDLLSCAAMLKNRHKSAQPGILRWLFRWCSTTILCFVLYHLNKRYGRQKRWLKQSISCILKPAGRLISISIYKTLMYGIGTRIDGLYDAGEVWFPGIITNVHEDNSFNVKYDDGEAEEFVAHSFLRLHVPGTLSVGSRVLARYNGGDDMYPGVISDIDCEAQTYDIAYDDGEAESSVPFANVIDEHIEDVNGIPPTPESTLPLECAKDDHHGDESEQDTSEGISQPTDSTDDGLSQLADTTSITLTSNDNQDSIDVVSSTPNQALAEAHEDVESNNNSIETPTQQSITQPDFLALTSASRPTSTHSLDIVTSINVDSTPFQLSPSLNALNTTNGIEWIAAQPREIHREMNQDNQDLKLETDLLSENQEQYNPPTHVTSQNGQVRGTDGENVAILDESFTNVLHHQQEIQSLLKTIQEPVTDNESMILVKNALSLLLQQLRIAPHVTVDCCREQSGESVLLKCIQLDASYSIVVCFVFVIIRRMCSVSEKSFLKYLELNVIEIVAKIMARFPHDAVLQASACGVLTTFARSRGIEIMIQLQVAQLIIEVLKEHQNLNHYSRQVHFYACEVLAKLCDGGDHRVLRHMSTLDPLCNTPVHLFVHLLRQGHQFEDQKVACSSCTLALCLAARDRDCANILRSIGALTDISTVMAKYPNDNGIAAYSQSATREIAMSSMKNGSTMKVQDTAKEILKKDSLRLSGELFEPKPPKPKARKPKNDQRSARKSEQIANTPSKLIFSRNTMTPAPHLSHNVADSITKIQQWSFNKPSVPFEFANTAPQPISSLKKIPDTPKNTFPKTQNSYTSFEQKLELRLLQSKSKKTIQPPSPTVSTRDKEVMLLRTYGVPKIRNIDRLRGLPTSSSTSARVKPSILKPSPPDKFHTARPSTNKIIQKHTAIAKSRLNDSPPKSKPFLEKSVKKPKDNAVVVVKKSVPIKLVKQNLSKAKLVEPLEETSDMTQLASELFQTVQMPSTSRLTECRLSFSDKLHEMIKKAETALSRPSSSSNLHVEDFESVKFNESILPEEPKKMSTSSPAKSQTSTKGISSKHDKPPIPSKVKKNDEKRLNVVSHPSTSQATPTKSTQHVTSSQPKQHNNSTIKHQLPQEKSKTLASPTKKQTQSKSGASPQRSPKGPSRGTQEQNVKIAKHDESNIEDIQKAKSQPKQKISSKSKSSIPVELASSNSQKAMDVSNNASNEPSTPPRLANFDAPLNVADGGREEPSDTDAGSGNASACAAEDLVSDTAAQSFRDEDESCASDVDAGSIDTPPAKQPDGNPPDCVDTPDKLLGADNANLNADGNDVETTGGSLESPRGQERNTPDISVASPVSEVDHTTPVSSRSAIEFDQADQNDNIYDGDYGEDDFEANDEDKPTSAQEVDIVPAVKDSDLSSPIPATEQLDDEQLVNDTAELDAAGASLDPSPRVQGGLEDELAPAFLSSSLSGATEITPRSNLSECLNVSSRSEKENDMLTANNLDGGDKGDYETNEPSNPPEDEDFIYQDDDFEDDS